MLRQKKEALVVHHASPHQDHEAEESYTVVANMAHFVVVVAHVVHVGILGRAGNTSNSKCMADTP